MWHHFHVYIADVITEIYYGFHMYSPIANAGGVNVFGIYTEHNATTVFHDCLLHLVVFIFDQILSFHKIFICIFVSYIDIVYLFLYISNLLRNWFDGCMAMVRMACVFFAMPWEFDEQGLKSTLHLLSMILILMLFIICNVFVFILLCHNLKCTSIPVVKSWNDNI